MEIQKQLHGDRFQKSYFEKFNKINWKTPMSESLFFKTAMLKPVTFLLTRLRYKCIPEIFEIFGEAPFCRRTSKLKNVTF